MASIYEISAVADPTASTFPAVIEKQITKRWILVADLSGREIIGKHFVFIPYFGFGIRIITIRQQPYNLSPTFYENPVE